MELAAELEGRIVAELWQRGTLGVEVAPGGGGKVHLTAYFPGGLPATEQALDSELWLRLGVERTEIDRLPAEDWLARHRAETRPIEVGERFLVDPREPGEENVEAPAGRRLLRIPARAAFGTGSHESTRLTVELMEGLDLAGRRVLDVGAGSGILSFVALALGAARVTAVEIDPVAALLAGQNRRLNRLAPRLVVGRLEAVRAGAGFEVALVNVLPERIRPDLPRLARVLAPGATAVFSGILGERRKAAERELAVHGFRKVTDRSAGEWWACSTELGA